MLKKLLLTLLAILVIFEEWLWDILTAAGQWLARVFDLARFDAMLMRASPPLALVAMLIPMAIVTPINLFAIFLLTHGGIIEGILLEVVAKLLGTLLVARVFKLVRPALLTYSWFAKIYEAITGVLRWAHEQIRDSAIYKLSLEVKTAVKNRMKVFLRIFRR